MYSTGVIHLFPSRAIAIILFGFPVYWYGLLYLLGFLNALWILPKLSRYRHLALSREEWSELLSWAVVGVIVGGRLGYVFLYEPAYFLNNPLQIFAIRDGGMAFHGGFIGVLLAVIFFVRRYKINLLRLTDVIVVPVAIGLALGRLGNFLNQELYGTVTTLPWGMHFAGAEGLRHPLQIYGIMKDSFLAVACYWTLRQTPAKNGSASAMFLIVYGTLRFLLEYIREQNESLFIVGPLVLTRGQTYCIPMVIMGAVLVWMLRRSRSQEIQG